MASKYFSKGGSVAGWDKHNRQIVGKYFAKSKSWAVWIDGLVVETRQNFATSEEADRAIEQIMIRKFDGWD